MNLKTSNLEILGLLESIFAFRWLIIDKVFPFLLWLCPNSYKSSHEVINRVKARLAQVIWSRSKSKWHLDSYCMAILKSVVCMFGNKKWKPYKAFFFHCTKIKCSRDRGHQICEIAGKLFLKKLNVKVCFWNTPNQIQYIHLMLGFLSVSNAFVT